MAEQWNKGVASDVQAGDQIRLESGRRLVVSRIEEAFMGRPEMVAFIQDTSEGWFKQPMRDSTPVEVLIQE
jgi:hypothetical protein